MKTLIAYYSTYGHEYGMAEAVVGGVKQIDGAEPRSGFQGIAAW